MMLRRSLILFAAVVMLRAVVASAAQETSLYADYLQRRDDIRCAHDISTNGFVVIENQIFPIEHARWGVINLIPAIDYATNRLALFFTQADGTLLFKTDAIASNYLVKGGLRQLNAGLPGVAFNDMDGDGLDDIMLIIDCKFEGDPPEARPFKMAEVLYQNENGYFNDRRVTDRLNRFGMNSSIDIVTAHLRDKKSTEFLYTAQTRDELLSNGFDTITGRISSVYFEKFGQVQVLPGTYKIAEQFVFLIYLINEEGRIVWNFQPMREHDNFSYIRDISYKDIDGDGLKDVLVVIRYAELDEENQTFYADDFSIYYQRAGYFSTDTDFKKTYSGEKTLDAVMEAVRAYWRAFR